MRTPTRVLSAALVAAAVTAALSGCVVTAGPATTEEHDVSDGINAVELRVPGDLTIELGDRPGLTVTAGENVIDRIAVGERGDVLVIGRTPGPFPWWGITGETRFELTLTSLEAVAIHGAGDIVADFAGADRVSISIDGSGEVEASGIDADDVVVDIDGAGDVDLGRLAARHVEVSISGSGDVDAVGTADSIAISIDGSGDVDTEGLVVADAEASIRGSGDISVAAEETLTASISGSGTIRYRGDPRVDSHISGSGDIVQLGR